MPARVAPGRRIWRPPDGSPTLEAVVPENPARLRKVMRPDIGIALIDLDWSES
jgi:hypothetical protein